MFAPVRRAPSRINDGWDKVAGNKLWAQGFSAEVTLGAAHEAFAVHPGSFHACRLHRKTRRSGTKLPLLHL